MRRIGGKDCCHHLVRSVMNPGGGHISTTATDLFICDAKQTQSLRLASSDIQLPGVSQSELGQARLKPNSSPPESGQRMHGVFISDPSLGLTSSSLLSFPRVARAICGHRSAEASNTTSSV